MESNYVSKSSSRNELFMKSFTEGYIPLVEETLSATLLGSTLEPTSPNKQQPVHKYLFTIPKKYELCHSDIPYIDAEFLRESGPVYAERDLQSMINIMKRCFMEYFGPFSYGGQISSRNTCVRLTNTNIICACENGSEQEQLVIDIEVCYFVRNYLPYPIIRNDGEVNADYFIEIQKLYEEIRCLEDDNQELKHMIYNDALTCKKNQESLKNKVGALYKELCEFKKQESCPVCYEDIEPDKLFVAGCTHFICTSCSAQCKKCPLCRSKYI